MTSTPAPQAQQGHRYRITSGLHMGADVLALTSGPAPRVAVLPRADWPFFLGHPSHVTACCLQPLPMTYFHGQAPAMS